jgi:hypothetical protein
MKAWAAGFIDGEGTISVKRFFRNRKNGRYIYYQPFLSLSQAVVGGHDKGVFKMQELFGGSVSHWHGKTARDGYNRYPTVQWSVVSNDALKCINMIYPYLVCKKENADVILRFYKERNKGKGGSGKVTLTKKEQKFRESLFYESRKLNQKGKLYLQRLNEETAKADVIV